MKIVVIGAGASLEESIRLGVNKPLRPPLINNFGGTLWTTNLALPQSLYNFMSAYLQANGHETGSNPISTFIQLEALPDNGVDVEKFFEYAWLHRGDSYNGAWGDLLYGGVINPLIDIFARNGFFENGIGWRPFAAYQCVANKLNPGDLVVNLNYEPLFEMGARQAGCDFEYIPDSGDPRKFQVAKPHGSINLIVEKYKFWFSEPDIIGSVMAQNEHMEMFRGIIPPRYNKSYQQHPIAKIIFDKIRDYIPDSLTFWGVGFAGSDIDLVDIYKGWCERVQSISLIHPCPTHEVQDAEQLLGKSVQHFKQPEDWGY